MKVFKDIGFSLEIETNLQEVNFLDVTLNLRNGTYRPYKKPNDKLLYIHTSSNHPPNVLMQIPISIKQRLSNNSSNATKIEYEDALKKSGFQPDFKFNLNQKQKPKNRNRKVIWFNPPFNKAVSTNVAKIFLRLIDKHFPKSHKLQKCSIAIL